jgi:hypothetical protein
MDVIFLLMTLKFFIVPSNLYKKGNFMKKICSKCKEEKDIEEFHLCKTKKDGRKSHCKKCLKIYYEDNKEKIKERNKEYYKNNKDEIIERNKKYRENNKEKIKSQKKEYQGNNKEKIRKKGKEYREDNKEKIRERGKEYREDNKEKIRERKKEYVKKRYKIDPIYKLRRRISCRIYQVLKDKNSNKNKDSILKYLPYTIEELKQHLENLFEDWMTWENYGMIEKGKRKWNIDHIIPQSLLLYDSMEHLNFLKCWSLENLRPLEIMENINKSNKLI